MPKQSDAMLDEKLEQQLTELKQKEPKALKKLPEYSEVDIKINGRKHWVGIWHEQKSDGSEIIVAQCRNPDANAENRSYARGFYLDPQADYPPASDEDLRAYT